MGAFFIKAIIPLALVGYEMIIANSVLRAALAMSISYPTRARGITEIVVIDWKTSSACLVSSTFWERLLDKKKKQRNLFPADMAEETLSIFLRRYFTHQNIRFSSQKKVLK